MGKRFKLEEMIEVTYLETIDDVSAIQSILGISTDKVKSVAKYKPYLISENEEKLAKHGIDTNTTDSPIIIFDNGEYETITTGFNESALIDLIKEIETNTPKENEGA